MIRQHRPDIVLLDVNMPLMDGLDALFQTRGLYFFVPIVVTGYSDFDYAKRAMYSGVQRYLLKPVVAPNWRRPSALPSRSWSTTA